MTQSFDVNVEVVGGGAIMAGMEEMMKKGAGNGPPQLPAGGQDQQSKGDKVLHQEAQETNDKLTGLKGFMGRLGKTLGIQVGLSSILKQSQIFTGTIGSIFQIFGALVDVILAPFLPIIVPAIRFLAGLIPVIHTTIQGIFNWIKEKLPSKDAFNGTVTNWGNKLIDSLFFLPEDMREKMKTWWSNTDHLAWMKKAGIGLLMVLALKKFGMFEKLGGIFTKIPIVGPMFSALGNTIGTALKGVLGMLNPLKAMKVIPGKGIATSGGSHIAGKIGGMFGALKGLAGKGAAKLGMGGRIGGMVTGALGKVGGAATLGKLIPGIGGIITAGAGIKNAIDVFKNAEGGFMERLGKASAVGAVGVAGGALSMVPGMGLVAPIAAGVAGEMLKNKFMPEVKTEITVVGSDGRQVAKDVYNNEAEHKTFQSRVDASNAGFAIDLPGGG